MGFMGLIFAGIVLIILGVVVGLGFIALIIGIVLAITKRKKAAIVLFCISGIMLGGVILLVVLAVIPKPTTVETHDGKAMLMPSWIEQYQKCLDEHDIEKLEKLIDNHPEMVYYYDQNRVMLLDYGLYNCDVEIMRIALSNGAKFDEPLRYEHMVFYSSLDSFFAELDYPDWKKSPEELTTKGATTDEMIAAVTFAIDNGVKLTWEVNHDFQSDNFFDKAADWVNLDGVISEKDIELLKLLADSDEEMKERYAAWEKGE